MRPPRRAGALPRLLAAAILALPACDSPNRDEPPAAVTPVSGGGQQRPVGTVLPDSLVVRVTDDDGDPVSGVTVAWAVTAGGGSVSPATSVTRSDGTAKAAWTLGSAAGQGTVTATVASLQPASFTSTAVAGPASRVVISPDSLHFFAVGRQGLMQATLRDAAGNVVSGATVAWSTLDPGVASVSAAGVVQAAGNGVARIVAAVAGGGADTAYARVRQLPASVTLSPARPAYVPGDTARATALDSAGVAIPDAVWSTSSAAATVNAAGKVTAVSTGTANVIAQAGGGQASVPFVVQEGSGEPAFGMSAGTEHTCGLSAAGRAACWGYGSGRLGQGSTQASEVPVRVAPDLRFAVISAGNEHTCAVTDAGEAWCWGNGPFGELGTGAPDATVVPARVAGGHSFRSVSAGTGFTCGVRADGAALCWGTGTAGRLGNGQLSGDRATPGVVSGGLTWAMVSAGGSFACGVTTAGAAYCWGGNAFGQLGNGTTTPAAIPVPVAGARTFSSVSAGRDHACGVTTAAEVYCWGMNAQGQLGNGTSDAASVPVPVSGGRSWRMVDAGHDHTCAVTTASLAYCWGSDARGQLGNATAATFSLVPVAVSGGLSFQAVTAGGAQSCGGTTSGEAWCWGANETGQLGVGDRVDRPAPTRVQPVR